MFRPEDLDYELSPYTGLTRKSWIGAAKYLLKGVFDNLGSIEEAVIMPRYETKVTYPQEGDPKWRFKAEIFEGLARSFFIAAPLIHIEPGLKLNGINVRDYYRKQVLYAVTPGEKNYVLSYTDMRKQDDSGNSFAAYQQTVETAALVICLWMSEDEIWNSYSSMEKDRIAAFLSDFGHANTVPQNWRLFNMLDLAFLYMNGYGIDEDIMRDHAQNILHYYAGNGWYRDGHSFDYYSCWAFNMYTALWNNWYGYEKEPYIARRFEENSNELMKSYPYFFDRDGFTNMWGRSCIYRNAATSPFDANLMLRNPGVDPGLARRICSGSLLQFLKRDDFLYKGVPVLGFYGPFVPLVQSYSCAESPFWLAKALLCLHLPSDHPFWTAKENNGSWDRLSENENWVTYLNGPGLCITNHEANGTSELRTGKVFKEKSDRHGMNNYSKLVFNSKFPWEATVSEDIESQQYVIKYTDDGQVLRGNVTLWAGEKDDVLYRRQFFDYEMETECHWRTAIDLADFAVPYGIMRADKIRMYRRPLSITLGAFGFPDNGTEMDVLKKDGYKAVVLKGRDHMGKEKSLALTIFDGWTDIERVDSAGTNPDSEKSIVLYARTSRDKQYGYEPYFLISQVITKEETEPFTEDELFPVERIEYTDPQRCGGYGPVKIYLKSGEVRTIDFYGIEGKLSL